MTEVLFYHLQNLTLENVLPPLLEKSIQRGWRVVVQAGSDERIEALDSHLWTYRDDSFLPHGTQRSADAAEQPILLVTGSDNPNGAKVRFLVDGAALPDCTKYDRVVVVFNGDDDEALAQARASWVDYKSRDCDLTYWQADDRGKWKLKENRGSD